MLDLYYQVRHVPVGIIEARAHSPELTQDIATGRYAAGQRLPGEPALVKAFGASRPTVNRARRELQLPAAESAT